MSELHLLANYDTGPNTPLQGGNMATSLLGPRKMLAGEECSPAAEHNSCGTHEVQCSPLRTRVGSPVCAIHAKANSLAYAVKSLH